MCIRDRRTTQQKEAGFAGGIKLTKGALLTQMRRAKAQNVPPKTERPSLTSQSASTDTSSASNHSQNAKVAPIAPKIGVTKIKKPGQTFAVPKARATVSAPIAGRKLGLTSAELARKRAEATRRLSDGRVNEMKEESKMLPRSKAIKKLPKVNLLKSSKNETTSRPLSKLVARPFAEDAARRPVAGTKARVKDQTLRRPFTDMTNNIQQWRPMEIEDQTPAEPVKKTSSPEKPSFNFQPPLMQFLTPKRPRFANFHARIPLYNPRVDRNEYFDCFRDAELNMAPDHRIRIIPHRMDNDCTTDEEQIFLAVKTLHCSIRLALASGQEEAPIRV
eukprot:TRINITY_DN10896_c0_g1_i2.p1 TRINITY_DN10896_c0_g1~~TRINITY_DN10896_c0_g1_i2.p1  ORF type:complete len:332 (-),score=66.56 TRINITY_DN10896_c0_g1_i2:104-1099(-)